MASITRLGRGKQPPRAIDFVDSTDGGKRKRIRLGVVTHDIAEETKRRVEKLLTAKILNQPIDQETARWLTGISEEIHSRLARSGLCDSREPAPESPSLGKFCSKYLDQRKHELKPGSIQRLGHTCDRLTECFGPTTPISTISADSAKDWRAGMAAEGLAEATIRLHCRHAKLLFNDAVERELLSKSPFATLKSSSVAAVNDRFVSAEELAAILEACPNAEWRTLVGLARLAGLRCPSETHGVCWSDVDWDLHRLTVYAPKTDSTRIIPISASLLAILQDAFDAADDGSETILSLSRNNLHRGFSVILKRAGIIQWPDLFQTLRRSCEIEWATHFPQHAVSRWLGHSMQVSERHYLSVTDDLFEVAAAFNPLRAAESAAVGHGIGPHPVATAQDASRPLNAQLAPCHGLRHDASQSGVGRGGIEPPTPGFSILCSTN
jgi:integrase